jgi:hypothetical protein
MVEAKRSSGWRVSAGALCALAWLACAACTSDDPPIEPSPDAGGGGTSANGGSGGAMNGGSGGSSQNDPDAECRCSFGGGSCPESTAALCATFSEGCPESIDTWLSCAARGEIGRDGASEPWIVQCGGYRIITRQTGYIGRTRWIYDSQGRFVGAENVSDTDGPRCGFQLPQVCRSVDGEEPFVAHPAADAGLDAAASGDGGPDAATDGGGASRAPECERL